MCLNFSLNYLIGAEGSVAKLLMDKSDKWKKGLPKIKEAVLNTWGSDGGAYIEQRNDTGAGFTHYVVIDCVTNGKM